MTDEARHLIATLDLDVRWGDMDALGHVNNTVYFRYMEHVRCIWLEKHVGELKAGEREGTVIADAHCTFAKPIVYPQRLRVDMYGSAPGRSSFNATYDIIAVDDDGERVCAHGATRIVWIDQRAGRSAPLPERIRAQLPAAESTS